MARTAQYGPKLENKSQRSKLAVRRKPYCTSLEPRLTLGYYRKSGVAGRWVARREIGRSEIGAPLYKERTLGLADDLAPADAVHILSYEQARRAAASGELTSSVGPMTV